MTIFHSYVGLPEGTGYNPIVLAILRMDLLLILDQTPSHPGDVWVILRFHYPSVQDVFRITREGNPREDAFERVPQGGHRSFGVTVGQTVGLQFF